MNKSPTTPYLVDVVAYPFFLFVANFTMAIFILLASNILDGLSDFVVVFSLLILTAFTTACVHRWYVRWPEYRRRRRTIVVVWSIVLLLVNIGLVVVYPSDTLIDLFVVAGANLLFPVGGLIAVNRPSITH